MQRYVTMTLGIAALTTGCTSQRPLEPASREQPTADITSVLSPYSPPADLGTLGGSTSLANAINNRDDIVGESKLATGETHAFLYSGGAMQDLGTLGGDYSSGADVNSTGQVAGISRTADGVLHAFRWDGATMVDLGPASSGPVSMNDDGKVMWTGINENAATHAFVWDGSVHDLGTLGGSWSQAQALSEVGWVAGVSEVAPGSGLVHAFLWDGEAMTDLESMGTPGVAAFNSAGQAAGAYSTSFSPGPASQHAILWDGGRMSDLGYLPGDQNAFAVAINDSGQVAGNSYTDIGYTDSHPFRWQAGVMIPLNPTYRNQGNVSEQAVAMNGSGVVAGKRYEFLNGGRYHAMIWDNGMVWDLGTLTPDSTQASSWATAINDRGTVAGQSNGRAVIWRRSNVLAVAP